MRFFKYLIFLFLTLFSVNAFAVIKYKVNGVIGDTREQACKSFGTSTGRIANVDERTAVNGSKYYVCKIQNSDLYYSIDEFEVVEQKCEKDKETYLDGYIGSSAPASACYNGCLYNNKNGTDGTANDTPNGNLEWGFQAINSGQTCDKDTDKGEDTPKPPEMDKCLNAQGSDAYCPKDPNKNCPSGYKEQTFNNEKLCVKDGDPNDPSSSQPTDPNDPSSSQPTDPNDPSSSQPGTGGGGTDLSGVIAAIKSIGSSITGAINSLSKTLTDAINKNGKNTVDAIDKNTTEVKKGNGFLEEIKDWLFNDELPNSTDNKAVTDSDLLEDNESTFRFGAQCPAPVTEQISIIGYSWTFSFSFESYCTVLTRLAPYFVFSAYLAAAFIIAGVRDA